MRIPIGYWATKPEQQISPYSNISLNYLDKAFEICDQLNLAIIIDLHGVKDSQNGWDHSGWARDTQHWTDNWEENLRDTIESLVFLTKRYTNRTSFFGIELVNEPLYTIPLQKITEFYYKSYEEIRKINKEVIIIMSDSFRGHAVESTTFIPKLSPNFTRVMIDIHNYQCFNEADKKLTTEQHLDKVENEWLKAVTALSKHNLVITGEWSLALEWHTYLGLQPDEIKTFKKIYFLTQKNIFEAGDGSVFWSWKLQENDSSWAMEKLFNDGYIE